MKYVPKHQKGMTGIALAISIAILLFFVWLTLVLYPIYYEHFKVTSHLNSLSKDNDLLSMNDGEVVDTLVKIYGVDDVDNVHPQDITVSRVSDAITVVVEYEVRKKVIANIDVIVSFHNEQKYKF